MSPLPIRGVLAPAFLSLAVATGVLNMSLQSTGLNLLFWLFIALVLVFASDSGRLMNNGFKDADGA